MDPVAFLVAALLAGSAAGVSSTASDAVHDAYSGLRGAIRQRLSRADGSPAIERIETVLTDPASHCAELERVLAEARVVPGEEVVRLALRVLELVDPNDWKTGQYVIDLRDARGVQIGTGNKQTNYFS